MAFCTYAYSASKIYMSYCLTVLPTVSLFSSSPYHFTPNRALLLEGQPKLADSLLKMRRDGGIRLRSGTILSLFFNTFLCILILGFVYRAFLRFLTLKCFLLLMIFVLFIFGSKLQNINITKY